MVRSSQAQSLWISNISAFQLGNLHTLFQEYCWSNLVSFTKHQDVDTLIYNKIQLSINELKVWFFSLVALCFLTTVTQNFCLNKLPTWQIMSFFRESDKLDEDSCNNRNGKHQLKLSDVGLTGYKRKSEDIESSGKGRCKFFQARKLQLVSNF